MAQWISIEEAAAKYGFETEYIWVLIEMREITVDYERPGIDIIDAYVPRYVRYTQL